MHGTIDSRLLFALLVALIAGERLTEMRISARNTRRLLKQGGVEACRSQLLPMIVLHATFLAAAPVEVWLLGRPFVPAVGWTALAVMVVAQGVRFWTLGVMGERWTVRVVAVPGERAITSGPFRFVRHPNYAVVAAEIVALPLVHTAWMTAVIFSVLNGGLLAARIRCEERHLASFSDYQSRMGRRGRFLPRRGSSS
jgi:methyltransferase